MLRKLASMALIAVLIGAAQAQDPGLAANLRDNNTARSRLAGLERAIFVNGDPNRIAAERLVAACQQLNATTVYLTAPTTAVFRSSTQLSEFRWRNLLSSLHRIGVEVYGVIGVARGANPYINLLSSTEVVARFGRIGMPGEQFDGVLIEDPGFVGARRGKSSDFAVSTNTSTAAAADASAPQAATAGAPSVASSEDAVKLLAEHLDAVTRLRRTMNLRYGSQRLKVGLVIPTWLNFDAVWQGAVQPANEHLANLADFVVVRNTPDSPLDIGAAADALVAYNGGRGVPTLLTIGIRPTPSDTGLTASLNSRDQLFAEQLISETLGRYTNAPGFGGVAIDDWLSYISLPLVYVPEPLASTAGPIDLDRVRPPY